MNKSAIEKMVEWLEEKVNPNNNEILSNADHLVVETYHEALKKAISLLAEEQAQKEKDIAEAKEAEKYFSYELKNAGL